MNHSLVRPLPKTPLKKALLARGHLEKLLSLRIADPPSPASALRIAFIIGLILAPLTGSFVGYALAEPQMPASWVTTVGGGLLVGFGTRQGGGCTSGHGVCGVARLSIRSIAATAIFMATAVVVVFLARHVFGS